LVIFERGPPEGGTTNAFSAGVQHDALRRNEMMKMRSPHVRIASIALLATGLLKGNKLTANSAMEAMRT
jgi:hypothetical protein